MTTEVSVEADLQSLLETIAREELFKHPKISLGPPSNPGGNLCSHIYRAVISETESDNRSLSLVCKVSLPRKSSDAKAGFKNMAIQETNVYKSVLPRLNSFLKKYGLSNSECFPGTARHFVSQINDSRQILIFQDKCSEGFRALGEEVTYLDLDHCQQIVKAISLLHAASIALREHEPEAFEDMQKSVRAGIMRSGPSNRMSQEFTEVASTGLRLLPDSFKERADFKRMKDVISKFDEHKRVSNSIPPDFSCLIHGDCWVNNFLYKYSKDESLEAVCFIDFQSTKVASPASELSYMLYTCTSKEMRDQYYDKVLECYFTELSSYLRKMACDPEKIVSLELLHDHMKRYGKIGPMKAVAGFAPFLIDNVEEDITLEYGEDEDSVFARRTKLPPNPETRKQLEKLLMDVVVDSCNRGII